MSCIAQWTIRSEILEAMFGAHSGILTRLSLRSFLISKQRNGELYHTNRAMLLYVVLRYLEDMV
jgi:hypothetical protein